MDLRTRILGRHILSSSMGLPAWIIHPPGCRSCQIHGRRVQPTQLMLVDTRNMTRKTRPVRCKGLYVPSAPGRTDRARAPCVRGRKRQLVRCGSKLISQPVDAVRGTGGQSCFQSRAQVLPDTGLDTGADLLALPRLAEEKQCKRAQEREEKRAPVTRARKTRRISRRGTRRRCWIVNAPKGEISGHSPPPGRISCSKWSATNRR